jgi:hypothetical protein
VLLEPVETGENDESGKITEPKAESTVGRMEPVGSGGSGTIAS